jgi:hypothetical protein
MAITSSLIGEINTTVLQVPADKRWAVTTILVCNYASSNDQSNDSTFDMHITQGIGGSTSNANKILNNVSVPAQETFTLSTERIILEENDRIIMISTDPDKLSTTISYLEV